MNSMKISIVLLALSGLSNLAFADLNTIKSANNQVGIQYVNTNVDYSEKVDGQTVDTEKGHVPGFGLSVSVMKDLFFGNDYFQAQFTRLNGDTKYSGSLFAPGYVPMPLGYGYGSLKKDDGAQITDFSARYGKGFELNEQLLLTPYLEIGYHEWKRNLGNIDAITTAPHGSSSEKYSNGYLGLGAMAQVSPIANLVLSGNVFLGRTIGSNISVKGIPYYYVINGPAEGSQALGDSTIYKIGALADYAFSEKLHGNISIDYVGFDYGKSNDFTVLHVYEPDSKTRYTTVKVGIGYAF